MALYEAVVHPDATTNPRAKTTKNDINVFLETVIDELVEMFEKGVNDVWDEYKKEHVTIKAILSATIIDLPGERFLYGFGN